MNYHCDKCNKEFKYKSQIDAHNRRKTPCATKLKVLDLFCGCGGFSKGLCDANFDIIAGIDIWPAAIETYKTNFTHPTICADLTKLSPEEFDKGNNYKVDVIVGGPPCQGFSNAGRRNIGDNRNNLFLEFVKYLNYFKPKAFMMENVIGILSMKTPQNTNAIDDIMKELNFNYNCIICKLYASDFEVPQNRRRVIIIGIHKRLNKIPIEPANIILTKEERLPVKTVLLPRDQINQSYYLSVKALNGINLKKEKSKERGNGFGAQFLDLEKPSYTISSRYWRDGYDALVKYSDTEVRRLMILEIKRIQSFPDDFILKGNKRQQIEQLGNAVPPKFAYHLGNHLINILR